jgi:hypothetical protein
MTTKKRDGSPDNAGIAPLRSRDQHVCPKKFQFLTAINF